MNNSKKYEIGIKLDGIMLSMNKKGAFRNIKLINDIKEVLGLAKEYYAELKSEYNTLASNSSRAKEIIDEVNDLNALCRKLKEYLAIENSKPLANSIESIAKAETGKVEDSYSNKNETSKKHGAIKGTCILLAGLTLGGLGYSLISKKLNNDVEIKEDKPAVISTAEPTKTPSNTPKPETREFYEASDEAQVEKQANKIFDQYVNLDSVPKATKKVLNVETIKNVLRMCNGEFALKNGEVDYTQDDYTQFDEIANDINTYFNATSFDQFKTDLEYKPNAVFFEEGTLAREVAEAGDILIEKVYKDIKNKDIEAFREDSIAWGEFIRDTIIYNDSTGNVISIWQVEPEMQYPVVCGLISPYACSILEYSIGVDLATRDSKKNIYGDTFGICIPYCYNEHNELVDIPLSEMIYDIIETPMNDLAARAGHLDEWQKNNDSIIIQLYDTWMEYFDAKYEAEYKNDSSMKLSK